MEQPIGMFEVDHVVTVCDACEREAYLGPYTEALMHGWAERDYGIICPYCASNEVLGDVAVTDVDDAATMLGFGPEPVSP